MSISQKSRNSDEDSSFSVESFKNRVNVARSLFGDSASHESNNRRYKNRIVDKSMNTMNTSPLTIGSTSASEYKFNYSNENASNYSHDDVSTYTSLSPGHENCPILMSPSIPPEIALLSIETDLILDSIRSDGKYMVSPLKDLDHVRRQLNLDDSFDADSVSSFLSDDDGMKNEIQNLKYSIKAIRKDIIACTDDLIETEFENSCSDSSNVTDDAHSKIITRTRTRTRLSLQRISLILITLIFCSLICLVRHASIRNKSQNDPTTTAISNDMQMMTEVEEVDFISTRKETQDEVKDYGMTAKNIQENYLEMELSCPRQFFLDIL
jgi:hypothetical protein